MGLDYEVNVGHICVMEVLKQHCTRHRVKCLYCMPNQENLCIVGETIQKGIRNTSLWYTFQTLLEMHLHQGWESEDLWE